MPGTDQGPKDTVGASQCSLMGREDEEQRVPGRGIPGRGWVCCRVGWEGVCRLREESRGKPYMGKEGRMRWFREIQVTVCGAWSELWWTWDIGQVQVKTFALQPSLLDEIVDLRAF